MRNVKFYLCSTTGFINDRQLWATDCEEVSEYLERKYEGDFELFELVTEEDARKYLNMRGEYAPAPQIHYAEMRGIYPTNDELIEMMIENSSVSYNNAKHYERM